jgi:4-hydroxy-tetrahydrodipicolinate reductase
MKLALIGYGKMGRFLERTALERGHTVSAIVDPFAEDRKPPSGAMLYKSIAETGGLGGAKAAIDFTRPDTALDNIRALAELRVPAVVGTTGWLDRLEEARTLIHAADSSLFWAANFSLGVNIFYRIAAFAAKIIDPFDEYDVGGWEFHHNKKLDSPSGTAKILVAKVLAEMTRKKRVVWDKLDRPPAADEIHFPGLRTGSLPGVHALCFDSTADTIEIIHTARNREGLASGAIQAAEWLLKPEENRKGVFTMDDMLGELLGIQDPVQDRA